MNLINLAKIRINQGHQAIPAIKKAEIKPTFRGYPEISDTNCSDCNHCLKICPTNAISKIKINQLTIDLGKCLFCGDCANECKIKKIKFTNKHKLSTTNRDNLKITENQTFDEYYSSAITASKELHKLFGRAFKLRSVSAGGCNSCELELNACSNVNFDMQRFGIEIVASPRHADAIVITGPITKHMASALLDTYNATPAPKLIILVGACAISAGVFADSSEIDRSFLENFTPDLYIPGCPAHPLTIINGIIDYLKINE